AGARGACRRRAERRGDRRACGDGRAADRQRRGPRGRGDDRARERRRRRGARADRGAARRAGGAAGGARRGAAARRRRRRAPRRARTGAQRDLARAGRGPAGRAVLARRGARRAARRRLRGGRPRIAAPAARASVRRVPTTVRESAAPQREATAAARLALAAIVLLAAALRFATLRTQSVWFDEAATWDLVRRPFGAMLHGVAHGESTPPLFYVLEWGWTRVFGDGEAGLRSLPALAGLLTVPVARAIGRRAGQGRVAVGLAAAALVAVDPLLVWYSQEARSYALAVLLSALALAFLMRARDDPRPRVLAGWALAAALALATHYFTLFVLVPQGAWLLWRHPRRRAAL